jgi:hypothetical protein
MKMSGTSTGGKMSLEQQIEAKGDEVTLETVLNDSEIITECKWGNQKIIK